MWIDLSSVEVVTAVKNQGQCSSCLALSITGALEGALAVENGWTQTMSEQQQSTIVTRSIPLVTVGSWEMVFDFAEKDALCMEISVTTP